MPLAGLIDPAYLAGRSALISPTSTMASVRPGAPAGAEVTCTPAPQPERGTSHFVAVDRWGDVASETSTIESSFGSGLMVNGYYLNNELTDFSFEPEKDGCPVANRVEGGKRPRSSMSPTIVYGPDGHVLLAVGAAGGSTIPAQVARRSSACSTSTSARSRRSRLPMIYAPGDTVYVESGTFLEAMVAAAPGAWAQRRIPAAGHLQGQCDRMAERPLGRRRRSAQRGGRGSANEQRAAPARTVRQSRFAVPCARRREGRRAVPVGQARRRVALDQLGRGGAAGRGARRIAEADRARARRPRRAGQREPARMADRRSRDHGRRLRHRADLHHQHHARSRAHPRQFGRARGDRLEPEAGEEPGAGGADVDRMPSHHRHRGHPRRPGAGLGERATAGRS